MRHEPDQQAADWFARTQSGELSPAERASLDQWLDADPANAVAWARVEFSWERAQRLTALPRQVLEGAKSPAVAGRQFTNSLGWSIAAALMIVMLGIGSWLFLTERNVYETAFGERRTITLQDGSRVYLNTDSRVQVAFSDSARVVKLGHGEALFEVAHDTTHPFIVQAGGTEVRAVGTAFNVRLRNQIVEVTVTEGKVQLKPMIIGGAARGEESERKQVAAGSSVTVGAAGLHNAILLDAGSAAVSAAGTIEQVQLQDDGVRRRVAWRDGVIELQGETLAQAIEEFNRYRKTPIVIADPALATMRVGGRFQTDEADKFVSALRANFSIRAIQGSNGEIYLLAAD